MNTPKNTNKLNSLQIVRAVAMLLVLFIHLDVFSTQVFNSPFLFGFFMPSGDAGVNIFFVLSGFIIYYVHRQDIGKKIKFLPYLIKRFSRIYPAYWLVNMIIIPLHFLFPQFGAGNETQVHNIIFSTLLLPQTHAPIIHAAWSLSNEVFFYSIFSLLILFGPRRILPLIIFLILGTSLNIYFSFKNEVINPNPFLNVMFSYHNFEFLLGILSAHLVIKNKVSHQKVLLTLGTILLTLMIILEKKLGDLSNLRLFGYGIPAFLIILSLSSTELKKSLTIPKIFFPKLLLIGDASFSIYITHQLLISAAGRSLLTLGAVKILGPFASIMIVAIVTVLIGCVFHFRIEKPLIHYSRTKLLRWYSIRNKEVAEFAK